MKTFFRNKQTKSVYGKIYTTKSNPALPSDGEEWTVLRCFQRVPSTVDQTFVTLPNHLVDDYFTETKTVLRSEVTEEIHDYLDVE